MADLQVQQLSGKFASNIFLFYDDYADVRTKLVFDSADKWATGYLSGGATILNDQLVTSWNDTGGVYVDGTWQFSLYLSPEATTLAGARVNVDGDGVTYELSIDGGETFLLASGLYQDLDLTNGLDVVLKVNLAGGATQSFVSRASLTLYNTMEIRGTNANVPATLSSGKVIQESYYDPAAFTYGVEGPITVPGDPDTTYLGVEFTIIPDVATSTSSVFSLTPTALYVNGLPVTAPATLAAGEWAHVVAVFAANSTGFTVGAAGSEIGYLATYNQPISADQVSAIYKWWAGTSAVRITDPNTMVVSEYDLGGGSPWLLYADQWSSPHRSG